MTTAQEAKKVVTTASSALDYTQHLLASFLFHPINLAHMYVSHTHTDIY